MFPDILPTKLNIPQIRPYLVPRHHLLARLNRGLGGNEEAFSGKLSLISAPAGFGKTTLAVNWVRELQQSMNAGACWLSLDEQDNVTARFLAYLVAALQRVQPRWGQALLAMAQAPQLPPPPALMGSLIREMSASQISQPVVLVIDDFHLISERTIHEALAFLVEHQPPQFHLVIATREDPLLPLNRWRARRQVTELRLADLRFTRQETAVFLNEIKGLNLNLTDIAALDERTEGWIAGLQLAALSMRQSEDPARFVRSFTGSSRYLLDYLIEEVIQQQGTDVQRFLLQTSILPRLNPALCDAVTKRNDSAEMLTYLLQGNLFLITVDESRNWYRYHQLFAELLRHRLQMLHRDTAVLHRRAGAWFQNRGYYDEAIPHYLAAEAWTDAARLLLQVSERLLRRGEAATLLGWLSQLPPEKIAQQPPVAMQYVWALILTGKLDAAEPHLDHLAKQARETPQFLGQVLIAQAYAARVRHDVARTIALSEQALALLPPDQSPNSVLVLNLGIAYWTAGQVAEAERALIGARHAAQQTHNHYALGMAIGFLSLVLGAQGKLQEAADLVRRSLETSGVNPTNALGHRVLGALHYEWNELEQAADHLQQAERLANMIGNVELLGGIFRGWAQLQQALGNAAEAEAAVIRAQELDEKYGLSPFTRSCNAAAYVQQALGNGDLATAVHWAARVSEPADASSFFPRLNLTPARLLLAQGEPAAAAQELGRLHGQAAAAGWTWGVIELRALQALAAADQEEAMAYLQEALSLAAPAPFIRTFVDKGEAMATLLQQAVRQDIHAEYAGLLLRHLQGAAPGPSTPDRQKPEAEMAPAPAAVDANQQLVEPLSERELEILRLLAERYTNGEIARSLIISVNTVKTHLRHIYEKLGVHDRKTAVVRAREIDLLPSSSE